MANTAEDILYRLMNSKDFGFRMHCWLQLSEIPTCWIEADGPKGTIVAYCADDDPRHWVVNITNNPVVGWVSFSTSGERYSASIGTNAKFQGERSDQEYLAEVAKVVDEVFHYLCDNCSHIGLRWILRHEESLVRTLRALIR